MIVAEFAAALGLNVDEGAFSRGDKMLGAIKTAVIGFIGIKAAEKIGEMITGFAETAVEAKHLGERVGVTTKNIQELEYAAQRSGATSEDLQVSLQHLARGLEELRTKGSGPAADAFQSLGLSMAGLKGKSPDQILGVIADKFAKLPDGPRKTAAAMDLFGRSGTSLIPMLNKGSAGIAGLRQEAEKLGVVIDEEGIKKAEEFRKTNAKLHATLTGLKNQAIAAMLPSITALIEKLSNWVTQNRELIKSLVEGVITAIEYVAKGVAVFIEAVGAAVSFLQEHKDLATAILIALGAVITAFAIQAAIDWLLAFWPLALAVVVIALITYGVIKLWGVIKKGAAYAADAFRYIKDKAVEFARFVLSMPGLMLAELKHIGQVIKDAFGDAWEWVKKKFQEAEDYVSDSWLGKIVRFGAKFSLAGDLNAIRGGALSGGGMTSMVPSISNPSASNNVFNFNGDVRTEVNAKTNADPKAIADLATEQSVKATQDMLRHAKSALVSGEKP